MHLAQVMHRREEKIGCCGVEALTEHCTGMEGYVCQCKLYLRNFNQICGFGYWYSQ